MIRVTAPGRAPWGFNARCRTRGRKWLRENPDYDRPRDYWTEFEPALRRVFRVLCGYCAMTVMKGEIDHFVPAALLKERGQHRLAYEWSNFRYGEKTMNGRK